MLIAEPVTSTIVVDEPTSSLAFTVVICPTCTTDVVWKVLKFGASTFTVYFPGARAPTVKYPALSVPALKLVPTSALDTVTFAPGTAAPCGSTMVPVIPPVETVTWLKAAGTTDRLNTNTVHSSANQSKPLRVLRITPTSNCSRHAYSPVFSRTPRPLE